jgi:hypothetical protein
MEAASFEPGFPSHAARQPSPFDELEYCLALDQAMLSSLRDLPVDADIIQQIIELENRIEAEEIQLAEARAAEVEGLLVT